MAMSGVTVADDVVAEFNKIKLGHSYRYIQMKMSADNKVIEMEKTVEKSGYDEFVHQLPEKDCRYAVYDFEYDMGDSGQRQQLIFVVWCPDSAPVRVKMLYAASKDALKKKLVGMNHEIQATEHSELNQRDVLERVKSKAVK